MPIIPVKTDIEVLGVDVRMLGKVEVLLGHKYTLCSRISTLLLWYVSR